MAKRDALMESIDRAASACPGQCNFAWRQAKKRAAEAIAKGGRPRPHDLQPVPGAPVWCRNCQTTIVDAVSTLPGLAADLAAMPGGQLLAAETQGRFATRAGSPSGSPAWDAADEIVRWACDREAELRDHLGHRHPPQPPVRVHLVDAAGLDPDLVGPVLHDPARRRRLVDAVAYLRTWSTAWLSTDYAVQDGRQALQLARRGQHTTGQDRLVHHLPLPCLRCDAKALRREDGSETCYCKNCDARWTEGDYQRLAHAYAESFKRNGTMR